MQAFLIFNRATGVLCDLSTMISAPQWFGWDENTQGYMQLYILGWFAPLALLFAVAPESVWPWGLLVLILPVYRLQDLFFATLVDGLNLRDTYAKYDATGRILILLVNLLQIVIIFAILYRIIVGPDVSATLRDSHSQFDYFLLSWKSLPPFGNLGDIQTRWGQALGMLEAGIGIVVGGIALGAFVGRQK